MKPSLSLVMITKNAEALLDTCLDSVKDLADEIIAIDDYSQDRTIEILKHHRATIFNHHEYDLGKQRLFGLKKANGTWILVIDSDEVLSPALKKEIYSVIHDKRQPLSGFFIRFQTHFLGKPLHHGGEAYKKMILFKKNKVDIKAASVHEKYELTRGRTGTLKHEVYHYSYRSLWEMYGKFTDYSIRDAKDRIKRNETVGIKHLTLYPIHMFWSRFIADKGYRDGIFRLPLDLGFAYMELLTYCIMVIKKISPKKQSS